METELRTLETQQPPASTGDEATDHSSQTFAEAASMQSTLPPDTQDYDPSINATPYSPFYRHATPNRVDMARTVSDVQGFHDLERGVCHDPNRGAAPPNPRPSKLWKEKKGHCACWREMNKIKRTSIEMVIAVIFIGTMLGVVLGLTTGPRKLTT